MNHDNFNIETGSDECKALLETSTQDVYRKNAFRITGLPADVSIRDIKRRIDDLRHAEEIGDVEDEHSHAFALTPPPTLDDIRKTAQILQDPERRIIHELYWFWPLEWGKGKTDPALAALNKGDKTSAFNIWKQALNGQPGTSTLICKHNIAVLYHLVALDEELFKQNPNEEKLKLIDKYWWSSFKYWEEIIRDDHFWNLVTNRILSAGDPRLTADFAMSLRATLPKALHKIHGELALAYAEKGNVSLTRKHADYMSKTFQGLADDVSTTFNLITKPIQARVRDAVANAARIAGHQPDKASDAASDLFQQVEQPLEILKNLLDPKDHNLIDLLDAVADAGLTCHMTIAREQEDWIRSRKILEDAERYATSADVQARIAEQYSLCRIMRHCEMFSIGSKNSPENAASEGNSLLSIVRPLIAELDASGAHVNLKNRAKEEVAGTVAQCAIAYGNKTEDWENSMVLLAAAQQFAVSDGLKDFIDRNLKTVRQNIQNMEGSQSQEERNADFIGTADGTVYNTPGSSSKPASRRAYSSAPSSSNWKGALVVLGIIGFFIIVLGNNNSQQNHQPSYAPAPAQNAAPTSPRNDATPSPQSYDNRPSRSTLKSEIENGKRRADEIETQIREMDNSLQDYNNRLTYYRNAEMVDEHNALIPTYNALVQERKSLYYEYSQLIDDINSKVRSYNAGSR